MTKQATRKFKPIRARRRLFLTGTPMTARPFNLWPICEAFDPHGLGKSYKTYIFRYCGAFHDGFALDTSGASNLEELQLKLRKSFMIRRDKREVMEELPEKQRQVVLMPDDGIQKRVEAELSAVRKSVAIYEELLGLSPAQDDEQIIRRFWETIETRNGRFVDQNLNLSAEFSLAFEELSIARRELALAKIPLAKSYIDSLVEAGEKVIVFCHHSAVAESLRLNYVESAFITGKVPSQKRQAEVDRFQDEDYCRVMIANMDAGGVGFTMTAATHVVFIELSFNPSVMEQAEDRAWRDGQRNAVTVHYLIVEGSFDSRNINILEEKSGVLEQVLDASHLQLAQLLENRD